MSAYKKLKKEDSFLTDYLAHKEYTLSGSALATLGVHTYGAISSSNTFHSSNSDKRSAGTNYEHYLDLTYKSIYHLYYSNFDSLGNPAETYTDGSGSISGSRHENFMQSSYRKGSRKAQDRFCIISIPREHFGVNIKPGSVILKPSADELTGSFVGSGYTTPEDYVEEGDEAYGSDSGTPSNTDTILGVDDKFNNFSANDYISASLATGYNPALIDDGDGHLILSSSSDAQFKNVVVGNIIYSHGLIIISTPQVANYYLDYFSGSLSWSSSHPIYTYNFNCNIQESEFNFTQNPSAVKNTSGSLSDNVTGSYFQPYVTTVGLYNEANELVAVAKMGQPVPVSEDTEMTIKVKLDT